MKYTLKGFYSTYKELKLDRDVWTAVMRHSFYSTYKELKLKLQGKDINVHIKFL